MERDSHRRFPVIVYPDAVLADDVKIDDGSVVMAGTVINSRTKLGKGCIVSTSSSIDHDCSIGDYCQMSVESHPCGIVVVEDCT